MKTDLFKEDRKQGMVGFKLCIICSISMQMSIIIVNYSICESACKF